MKRAFAGLFGSALAIVLAAGCGGRRETARHQTTQAVSEQPTPDTTPVEALRTPAGLALKPESTATPSPGAASSSAAPAGGAGTTPAARPTP